MSRILWIVALTFAFCIFAGLTLLDVIALITRHHLNLKGWVMLFGSGYGAWIIFRYLH